MRAALLTLVLAGCAHPSAPPAFDRHFDSAMLTTDAVRIYAEDGSLVMTPGQIVPVTAWLEGAELPTEKSWPDKGLRVRVAIPGHVEPLYGILAFHHLARSTYYTVGSAYQIRVPDADVEATANGVRVVYDKYRLSSRDYPAWVLWLSRSPFPPKS